MQLKADELLIRRLGGLKQKRALLTKRPGLALIWVGEDKQTALFVAAKQKMAKELDVDFYLHHFKDISDRQLTAVIDGLNSKKEIQGIVLQLPLPAELDTDKYIAQLNPLKDIDGLTPNSSFDAPTALGVIELLKSQNIDFESRKTMIIGDGRLVGRPLRQLFELHRWPFTQLTKQAEKHVAEIRQCDLVISCAGVPNLITPEMTNPNQIIIDGSGIDVDVKTIEPLVKAVTPKRGAVGPLTVSFLFENLFTAAH